MTTEAVATTSNDGIDITKSEVENATSVAKNGKSPGPDEIHVDVRKVLNVG